MIKMIALYKKKATLFREEFVRHYEEVHAPLVLKHAPMIRKYVRNHITTLPGVPSDEGPDFDCITEWWFDDMEALEAVSNLYMSEAGKVLRDDEENFLDRSNVVHLLVEEKISDIQGVTS